MEKATTHKVLPLLALLALLAHSSLGGTAASASDAPSAPLNERVLTVPVDPSPLVRLKVTVYMPSRGGPFPLALINHGASHDPANAPRIADNFIPYYFLSRGYAVAMPMMRGYAGSEGYMRPHGCDLVATGMDAARDLRKVLDYVKQQPGVDASRIVMVGKSMGGWNTLVFGAQSPADIKGLVSFAGGLKESDCHEPDASLINGAAQLGAHTKLRSIWFYGDNDQTFATSTWRDMFQRYAAAGAPAELVDYGTFQQDAHAMTASAAGLPLWVKKADAFLAGIGLPGREVNPEYLPNQTYATSAYADLNDVSALPYLGVKQRETLYRGFLAAPLPRAIAIGATDAVWSSGGFDAAATAMQHCAERTHYCQLYAVDNKVVWPRLESAPPNTHFAALTDAAAIPFLNAQGRKAYGAFLTSRRPRAFAIAPDGAWGMASGLDPMNDALVACANGHGGCRLYAVDGDVVWEAKTAGSASGK